MAKVSIFLLLLSQLAVLPLIKGYEIAIDADPVDIDIGLTETLDVNCTFIRNASSPVAAVVSIILLRANSSNGHFQELATLTQFSRHTVNVLTNENTTGSGYINPSHESYLSLHWNRPTGQQSGDYKCEVRGLDYLGHNLLIDDTVQVSVSDANVDDLTKKVSELSADVNSLKTFKVEMVNYTHLLERVIGSMGSRIERLEQMVKILQSDQELDISEMFYGPWTFRNHSYYLGKDSYRDSAHAITLCELFNATLAEIDDVDEYNFVLNITQHATIFTGALIAGTDEAQEGTWLLQSSGKPVPYLRWTRNEPSGGSSENCLFLSQNDRMADYSCKEASNFGDYPKSFWCELDLY